MLRHKLTSDERAKGKEARKNSVPKIYYSNAIRNFYWASYVKAFRNGNCGGDKLADNGVCNLYSLNTREKRRKKTKSFTRKAIVRECRFCMQSQVIDSCTSPNCALYNFGPNRKNVSKKDFVNDDGMLDE